ncbi:MAG: YraN family protein [Patescibacteria group bacterium]|nr:YraN family protein [Patescibacteria group bacterium]
MKDHLSVGALGENIACEYLKKNRFKILERNVRRPWGEIDVIARDRSGVLVFVEVKTLKKRGEESALRPEDNMTRSKILKTQKMAGMFANEHPELVDDRRGWRVDLITISLPVDGDSELTSELEDCVINHLENVE